MDKNEILEYMMNNHGVCIRRFQPCPTELDSLVERAKPWINKMVHIGSWHEIPESSHLTKMFPNDTRVGYVLEFYGDVPESELNGTWNKFYQV